MIKMTQLYLADSLITISDNNIPESLLNSHIYILSERVYISHRYGDIDYMYSVLRKYLTQVADLGAK